jgi:hypothetical protein
MNKKTKSAPLSAPLFDQLIRVAQSETIVTDLDCINKLLLIINEIGVLEVQGEDELRSVWFEVPRGKCTNDLQTGDFPSEDKIIDFMNLGFEKTDEIIKKSTWFPLRQVLVSS